MPLSFEALTILKYALTPSKVEPNVSPTRLLVSAATPPTRISVWLTPGWSTGGNCWLGAFAPAEAGNATAASAPAVTPRLATNAIARRPRIGNPPEHQGESKVS